MKLSKKLLASRVNSVRPYKSRSKRPCDFCRRRKTCCIIENTIPCMACVQFNKGECTFVSGPLKRGNRRASDAKRRGATREKSHDSDSSSTLGPDSEGAVSSNYDLGAAMRGPVQNDMPLGYNFKHVVDCPLSVTVSPKVKMELTNTLWAPSYLEPNKYPDQDLRCNSDPTGFLHTPETFSRQLTLSTLSALSSTSFWLESSSYDNILNFTVLAPDLEYAGFDRYDDGFDKEKFDRFDVSAPAQWGHHFLLPTQVQTTFPQTQLLASGVESYSWEQPFGNPKLGTFSSMGQATYGSTVRNSGSLNDAAEQL